MSSLIYFFKEALVGFKRNLSTALGSIITIFLSLLIIGVFLIAGNIAGNIVKSVENEVSITAYVADTASDNNISMAERYIEGLDGVKSVTFTTKEQAMEDFKNSMSSNPEIIDQLDGQNPLPRSINIELTDPQNVKTVADQIAASSEYKRVAEDSDDAAASLRYGQNTVERLFAVTNYLRIIGIALVILLIFIAMVFINNTIRLAILARRKEIAIMRLVGASNGFIRGPFLMEGALHALIGSLLAVGILELLRNLALPKLSTAIMWLPINLPMQAFIVIYIALIVAGLLIGLIGSALAMRRYLKV